MVDMSKPQFKIGDTVQLLSGGPQMTVVAVKSGKTECCWFDKEQKARRANFPQRALIPADLNKMSDKQLNAMLQRAKKEPKRKT
jgi:uncharacterized protein YodC (DUF2158 family)